MSPPAARAGRVACAEPAPTGAALRPSPAEALRAEPPGACPGPGLYVHIPFCSRKCFYCDFAAYVVRDPSFRRAYVDLVLREADLRAPEAGGVEFRTLYFGGGTPSLLEPEDFLRLVEGLRARFRLAPEAEITLEANPEDLDPARLAAWREAGVNRLSIGVQAAQDRLLRALGRSHTVEDAERGYYRAREAGFRNVNLDLMFGLPGQTPADWEATLDWLLSLDPPPEHVSCYGLQVEPYTPFARWLREGRLDLPGQEAERAMYLRALERLGGAGYIHYEVSNFARPGRACLHNLSTWRLQPYLGLGAGAWSYWGGRRWGNLRSPRDYARAVQTGRLPEAEVDEPRTARTERVEAVLLGTRLTAGLELEGFRRCFGVALEEAFGPALRRCLARGWMEIRDGRLRLTLEGLLLANEAWAEFV